MHCSSRLKSVPLCFLQKFSGLRTAQNLVSLSSMDSSFTKSCCFSSNIETLHAVPAGGMFPLLQMVHVFCNRRNRQKKKQAEEPCQVDTFNFFSGWPFSQVAVCLIFFCVWNELTKDLFNVKGGGPQGRNRHHCIWFPENKNKIYILLFWLEGWGQE